MFDTQFYRRATQWLDANPAATPDETFDAFEGMRGRVPTVYNIEPSNACPMSCKFCPRTTMMKRPVTTMSMGLFRRIVEQLRPHSAEDWLTWGLWCASRFGMPREVSPSENHFFLHVIPRVIQLHGYGEPLVDKHLPERIGLLTERGLPSYFSCNPAVLNETRFEEHMRAGLDYVKFSIESTDDERFKQLRGTRANFTESFAMIKGLLQTKAANGYKTTFVVTMLDQGAPDSAEEFARLKAAFKGLDVYAYHKSVDTRWYLDGAIEPTKSLHWSRPCLHPWASTTILASGEVSGCMEGYDHQEFNLGNARDSSLEDIWNSEAYTALRRAHVTGEGLPLKCRERCDMPTVGGLRWRS